MVLRLPAVPIHVDHGGGDGHNHAQQGGQQAETAAELDLLKSDWKSFNFC